MTRRICVVTGTRAEYGLLAPVMRAVRSADDFELQVVATGMHLSPEFGLTYRAIEADGFAIDECVEMLLSSDTPVGIAKSMGVGTIGFADTFARLRPDLLMLLGDRFELLSAAQAALVARIPVAHVSGGDVTEGAVDEAIRHAITKMSHLHFVTNVEAAKRVRQLGEDPQRVHLVGNPGLDEVAAFDAPTREQLEASLGFRLRARNLLVTFHPVTLDAQPAAEPYAELLSALDQLGPEVGLLFTMSNADTFGRVLITMTEEFVAARDHAAAWTSLGQQRYYGALSHVDAVVGNSSSGLLEAPSFHIPTVNVGDRQRGRMRADSVIDCEPIAAAILDAVRRASELDCSGVRNPYGDGHATDSIIAALRTETDYPALVRKRFVDLPEAP